MKSNNSTIIPNSTFMTPNVQIFSKNWLRDKELFEQNRRPNCLITESARDSKSASSILSYSPKKQIPLRSPPVLLYTQSNYHKLPDFQLSQLVFLGTTFHHLSTPYKRLFPFPFQQRGERKADRNHQLRGCFKWRTLYGRKLQDGHCTYHYQVWNRSITNY